MPKTKQKAVKAKAQKPQKFKYVAHVVVTSPVALQKKQIRESIERGRISRQYGEHSDIFVETATGDHVFACVRVRTVDLD